jgi:hypothetical protein
MTKLILAVLLATTGLAAAQPAPDPAAQTCLDALNKDPALAKRVISTFDKKELEKIDQKTIEAHTGAATQIAQNERHVIYAYAAMWILAAGFVVFLWRRQQGLKAEIVQLRRDLDAAAKEGK